MDGIKSHLVSVIVAFLALCLSSRPGLANVDLNTLKAAIIYNVAKFIEWPAESGLDESETINFCLVGEPELSGHMRQLAGRQVRSHTIAFQHIRSGEAVNSCDLLFVGDSQSPAAVMATDAAVHRPILLVGTSSRFTRNGGVIGLIRRGEKFTFEINLKAARSAGFKISAKLLTLASLVHDADAPPRKKQYQLIRNENR